MCRTASNVSLFCALSFFNQPTMPRPKTKPPKREPASEKDIGKMPPLEPIAGSDKSSSHSPAMSNGGPLPAKTSGSATSGGGGVSGSTSSDSHVADPPPKKRKSSSKSKGSSSKDSMTNGSPSPLPPLVKTPSSSSTKEKSKKHKVSFWGKKIVSYLNYLL